MVDNIVALESSSSTSNWMTIEWHLFPYCNRNCSYCTEVTHTNVNVENLLSFDKFRFGFDNLTKKINKDNIIMSFTGGEPTLLDSVLIEMLEYTKDMKQSILLTNGTKSVEYYKECLKYADNIIFSYNMEYTNFTPEQYADIKESSKSSGRISVRILYLPGTLKKTNELIRSLKKYNIRFEIRRVRPSYLFSHPDNEYWKNGLLKKGVILKPFDIKSRSSLLFYENGEPNYEIERNGYYSDEDLKFLSEAESLCKLNKNNLTVYYEHGQKEIQKHEIHLKQLNRFKGWLCWAGMNILKIDYDGTISSGNCRDITYGNVYEEFELPKGPIVCPNEWCCSITGMEARKVKNSSYLNKLTGNVSKK